MEDRSLAYASYWRNSLADAELGHGALKERDVKGLTRIPAVELFTGMMPAEIVQDCFEGKPEQAKTVEVVIRPRVHVARTEDAQTINNGVPEFLTPLITPAVLDREGRLYPGYGTVVPRDLLEPLEQGTFAIGNVLELDGVLATDPVPGIVRNEDDRELPDPGKFKEAWDAYAAGCERMLAKICGERLADSKLIERTTYAFLQKKDSVQGAARYILSLYDHMRRTNRAVPLFDRYASEATDPIEPCLPSHVCFAARLAHATDQFPQAPLQRDASNHLLTARGGEILAVNGPPGTGKTTWLLSVVATLWAKAALEKGEPPFIVAASTNNQAVTNIIAAFGRDFAAGTGVWAGHWIQGVKSFGAYFPARSREEDAAKQYQTRRFFDDMESVDAVLTAESQYLSAASAVFPTFQPPNLEGLSERDQDAALRAAVESVVERIHRELKVEVARLQAIETSWKELGLARAAVRAELGDDPAATVADLTRTVEQLEADKRTCDVLRDEWERFRAQESVFYALFSWLPPVARKRIRLARLFLKPLWPAGVSQESWATLEEIETSVQSLVSACAAAVTQRRQVLQRAEALLGEERRCAQALETSLAPLLAKGVLKTRELAEIDDLADKLIRFPIFLLTTHYWEGRWLLDMRSLLKQLDEEKKKRGLASLTKRWHRRMKLTPCVVSTFHMLPSLMRVSRYESDKTYSDDYAYNLIDLLIVDEAGQVLPEVAGASFALAKQALVIGDTLQIEPTWSIPRTVDIGNLQRAKLLPTEAFEQPFDQISDLGKTASSGSVMRIAQCATRYHQVEDLPRGLFLFEHRRCFDEIIQYCNDLCYHGKLIPLRGSKAEAVRQPDPECDRLPAMGYLHVDGICQSRGGGSRYNLLEAEVIAAWLVEQRQELEATYKKPLGDIVGIITPFNSQVQAISNACRKVGIRVGTQKGEVIVGTVHSLQGAERVVVLFSLVYSKHADGGFIDKSTSVLNVAASRAKNTFLVFGDMDVLEVVASNTPRGKLAARLFSDDSQELQFRHSRRGDLVVPGSSILQLRDAREHDEFLHKVIAEAVQEVHIVSPWIRLDCIRDTGALVAMTTAARRGVTVRVYTDVGSNTWDRDPATQERKLRELRDTVGALSKQQIQAVLVRKVHSKIVIGDENVYCVGSFNWFSARRDPDGARHETSLVYRGSQLVKEMKAVKDSLDQRARRFG